MSFFENKIYLTKFFLWRLLHENPWSISVLLLLLVFFRLGFQREIEVLNWVFTHYLFNYADEFVKRGLVGEVLRWLPWGVNRNVIQQVSVGLTAFGCLSLSIFFTCLYGKYKSPPALLMVLLAGLSPVTLLHFMFDVGRFDSLLYGLFSVFLLCFLLIKKRCSLVDGVLVVLFIALALLVHEAAFFMVVPLLLGCWFVVDDTVAAKKMQALCAIFAILATYWVSTKGAYSLLSFDDHLQLLRAQQGQWVNLASLRVLHQAGLLDNMYLTLLSLSLRKHYWDYAFLVILLLPLIVFLYGVTRAILPRLNKRHKVMLTAAAAPLLLCFLGSDHFRWFSLALTNYILGLFFLFLLDSMIWRDVQLYIAQRVCFSLIVIVTGFMLGAVGVNGGFEVVDRILSVMQ